VKRYVSQKECVNLHQKSFMRLTPGANLIKLFWSKITQTFSKPRPFYKYK
jgi:hypothetical protein